MNKIKKYFQIILATAFFLLPISMSTLRAQEKGNQEEGGASLIAAGSHIPRGKQFSVGIRISGPEGSHIYWKNPGEVGSPLKIHWNLPEGFVVNEEHWPAPQVFEEEGTTYFGYDSTVFIVADICSPESAEGENAVIQAHVEWLACNDSCIPGKADLQLSLPYGESNSIISSDNVNNARDFAQTLQLRPRVFEEGQQVVLRKSHDGKIIINIPVSSEAEKAWFISEKADRIFAYSEEEAIKDGVQTQWKLKVKAKDSVVQGNQELEGILLLTDRMGQQLESFTIRGHIAADSTTQSSGILGFATILVMAFLGGLFLNIMPCVLPLITLKVYGLIKSAGEQRSSVIKNGLCYTLGVVGCFWALAGVAFLLKTLGHNIGWGFQLQEPMFVATLMIIFFLFALSSLGLFEVGTMFTNLGGKLQPAETGGLRNRAISSLCNGILATLVTTPCTGPFLGSVLGLVMSLAFTRQLLIFTAIGLGMALPYLIFAIFPRMLVLLPKPGSWMSVFKQLTGFMLLGTVTWLAWIFGSETSTTALIVLLSGLWLSGFGAWILGKWGTPVSPRKIRTVASTLFFGCILGALSLGFVASRYFVEIHNPTIEDGTWQSFSLTKLEKLRKEGHAVFVNFTAKWCLTCQMNKHVLYAHTVQEMFKQHGVITLEADWTRQDPGITEELARLGRASVPSYVYYPPNQEEPIVLPEKITQTVIENILLSNR
ncbi:thioredoxin family protein [Chlamydia avium]|uniref:protein-disulfide reductase DsbD family protein n=1 Tax=Chlamydia avium TaxID=1457141 RepID=UPI0004B1B820